MTTATSHDRSRIPVAFYGRTARAQPIEQAAFHLAGQYLTCVQSLPTTALVTAVFYDLGPSNWLHPYPPDHLTIDAVALRRDGGIDHLLAEAQQTRGRRFDYLIVAGADRLCRSNQQRLTLVQKLRALGIHTLFADQPIVVATADPDRPRQPTAGRGGGDARPFGSSEGHLR